MGWGGVGFCVVWCSGLGLVNFAVGCGGVGWGTVDLGGWGVVWWCVVC